MKGDTIVQAAQLGSRKINKSDIRSIYALGAVLGLVESGNKDDLLHVLVAELTDKGTVSELTESEAQQVLRELRKRQQELPDTNRRKSSTVKRPQPGKATLDQQNYIWRLMHDLEKIDPSDTATKGERLCAAIKKTLKISATPADPFRWISTEQASHLIDMLKRYVMSAHKKKRKG